MGNSGQATVGPAEPAPTALRKLLKLIHMYPAAESEVTVVYNEPLFDEEHYFL